RGWALGSRLQARLAALRSSGDPTTMAEVAPASPPRDAAALNEVQVNATAFEKDYTHWLEQTELGQAYNNRDPATNRMPTAEEAAAMRAILDQHALLSDELLRSAAAEDWRFQPNPSRSSVYAVADDLPRHNLMRSTSRFADWDLRVLASEGKGDQ